MIEFKFDEGALAKIAAEIAQRTEAVVTAVATEMAGGDAAEINDELTRRLRATNVEPNAPTVLEIANQVAAEEPAYPLS